jgi:predicted PurR-regulated permease PerM
MTHSPAATHSGPARRSIDNVVNTKMDTRDRSELLGKIFATIGAFGDVFNQAALIFLLTVYIISEKLEERMFPGETGIMVEIETMTTGYISLKTILSFLTGAVVAIIMLILQVKLAVMWGILSFLLNYIPNVGSMIAMFLPMPIVIVDDNLETWQKIGAFVGPGCVQGYVGNALEPMVFGKSLNMTPLSILAALVAWSSVWGLLGAILSVPLLGIQKICLSHANHPLAKTVLAMIREDPYGSILSSFHILSCASVRVLTRCVLLLHGWTTTVPLMVR